MSNLRQVYLNLWIGDDEDCQKLVAERTWAIVHACKTCHQKALGYKGSLGKGHPEYLSAIREQDLFLNMIDTPSPNFFPVQLFKVAIPFIQSHLERGERVLIHCNHGYSRSPSIALVYLAKAGKLDAVSYDAAIKDYYKLDPIYEPGAGIWSFLTDHWREVIGL